MRQQKLVSAEVSANATVVVDSQELPPPLLPLRVLPSDGAFTFQEDHTESLLMQQPAAPAAASEGLLVCDFCGRGNFAGAHGLKVHQIKTPVLPSASSLLATSQCTHQSFLLSQLSAFPARYIANTK